MNVGFEHLHVHSESGSLLDGLGSVEEYAEKLKDKAKYLTISDHGMMSAVPRQIKAAKANNLKPIFACELYVNPFQIMYQSDAEFVKYRESLNPAETKILRNRGYHLLAIATTEIGYKNLVTLTSLAWLNGYYYKPRVNHEILLKYKQDIIFTSCCYAGEVAQSFEHGFLPCKPEEIYSSKEEAGFAMIEKYMAMFGTNFYLEIMLLDFIKQRPFNEFILKAANKYNIPVFLSNDCHYCNPEDSKYQRLMLMSQTKSSLAKIQQRLEDEGITDMFELQDTNLSLKTEDELNFKWENDFSNSIDYDIFTEAKRNTIKICDRAAGLTLDTSLKLPKIPDANEKLKELMIQGAKKLPRTSEYIKRLQEEYTLICNKNFASYFLIQKQMTDEARRVFCDILKLPPKMGVYAVGKGRGSAVGSLLCYVLGITGLDPVKHGLLFKRFLNEARSDLPDIDTDFNPLIRDYIKNEWAPNTFGRDYVCSVANYNTYGIKSVLQEMARVHDKPHQEIVDLTKKIRAKDSEGNEVEWEDAMKAYPDLGKYCEDNKDVSEACIKLLGRNRSIGKHAGGLIISDKIIREYIPLIRDKDGNPLSAYAEGQDTQDLSPLGFVKFDCLGIINLVQLFDACQLIKKRHNLESICALPGDEDWSDDKFLNDPKAIELANKANLKCIFQFDSDGIRNMVKKGGVDSFEDLVAYTSLYRPGPMSSGLHEQYIRRKKGQENYLLHPILEPILKATKGCLIYQETIMQVLNVIGRVPLQDCETLRKAISKKKKEVFEKYQIEFVANGQDMLGWSEEQVVELWKQIEAFAKYSFNKSHAAAYTCLSSMLLYLKAHFPIEFFTAILISEDDPDNIREYKIDAKKFGIKTNPVDIYKSDDRCSIVNEEIYYGLSNIKGISSASAQKIVACRPYTNFRDFLEKFGTDAKVIKPLVGLRLFGDDLDPIDALKYAAWYKKVLDSRAARDTRHEDRKKKLIKKLKDLIHDSAEIDSDFTQFGLTDLGIKEANKIVKAYYKSIEDNKRKSAEDKSVPNMDETDEYKEIVIEEKIVKILEDKYASESAFYGFLWHHPVEKSPDFSGLTFELMREDEAPVAPVEVLITSVEKKLAKSGKTTYWLLKVEDAQGEFQLVQVWQDDWDRFSEELKVGNIVRIKLQPPTGGFRRYTLFSVPKWQRDKLIPKKKENDFRVVVMEKE